METETQASTEYSAVRDGGAGVIDLSARGRLLVSGSEAVMFLNGLITNDMKTLAVDSWMPAVFPNVQGRLIAAVRVIHRHDGFLIDTESVSLDIVTKLLQRFTAAGDFHLNDLTSGTATLSVQGGNAAAVVRQVLGVEAAMVTRGHVASAQLENGGEVTVIRATHTGEDGFDLFIDAKDNQSLVDLLLSAGAHPVGSEAAETLRIEAGIPRFGIDMDETKVVTETNLDDAVSFTKGCYIGQEIIARIKYRGHVAKKLTGVLLEQEVGVVGGAKILSADEKEIGGITSATISPRLKQAIALAYVKYDYLEPGTKVKVVAADHEYAGVVAELPFVRGSWYAE
ncbi:MAG TPA: glycine cleavage T C-terminal barrel domain-containing protein [Pyrinomonadaceae bacterium]|nr:glycine cleavage T C-terminal barrel domain-containing protein [Pyrinomonadaceae bacterium]